MAEKKKKPLWEKTFDCPHCNESNHILVEKERQNEPVPAEYQLIETIEPASQTTLDGKKK